ncbi:hypothetical protein DV704_11530 [Meiothermus sp. QL-1]|uniref:hypothetical protein n=1 Tax=Meiothermus sp. QL-1 TaxID=2058095 RepID=UPI000E0BE9E5|nr:hypothetical protein [Meiothermus sp. QL-1]RDI94510.1 hypothetical protein DV704_11530 [Meiothermus sp. QL-1]
MAGRPHHLVSEAAARAAGVQPRLVTITGQPREALLRLGENPHGIVVEVASEPAPGLEELRSAYREFLRQEGEFSVAVQRDVYSPDAGPYVVFRKSVYRNGDGVEGAIVPRIFNAGVQVV